MVGKRVFALIITVGMLLSFNLALPAITGASSAEPLYQRRNIFGMHNLKDGGPALEVGMEWTRHLVGGGFVFDWVFDFEPWIEKAFQLNLVPCIRIQECSSGCLPDPGYAANVAWSILNYKITHPQYADRLVYLQLWNEPHDPRDRVEPDVYADYLVNAHNAVHKVVSEAAAAHPGLGLEGTLKTMTPGQNGPSWWHTAFSHNPNAKFAFDVWGTHPYPEASPPHYNLHDGDVYIETSKTIDSYLMDLDVVAMPHGNPPRSRRGFPVMITETAYGQKLGISYEGWPKTNRQLAADYNVDAFGQRWYKWPEIIAVHPFILANLSWEHFAWVPWWSQSEDSNGDGVLEPTDPHLQYTAVRRLLLDLEAQGMAPARLTPYRGPKGTIKGTITRGDTGKPLAYATLHTDGYEFGHVSLFDGKFEIHDVPVGSYTLTAEKNGYVSAGKPITVSDGLTTTADFNLAYRGRVSKGLYFVDSFAGHSGCNDCDLFTDSLGQTFKVPADVGFIKYAAAKPNVDGVTLKFSILQGGPSGPQVGTSISATLEPGDGANMIGAEWPDGQEPIVEPGGIYFLKVQRTDGNGIYCYASDSNPYADGNAYIAGVSHSSWDLYAVIRGLTRAENLATGSITGTVTGSLSDPITGVIIATTPGGSSTTSNRSGRFWMDNVTEGTYSVSASKAGYATQTHEAVSVSEGATTTVNFILAETENGSISGTLNDSATNPIADALVQAAPGDYQTATLADGTYVISDMVPDTYRVQVTKSGFLKGIQTGVPVNAGETTTVDIILTPVPVATPVIDNPDFEADGGFFGVASGWTAFGGDKWESVWDPERIFTQGVTDIPLGAYGGVYQKVRVTPGASYRVLGHAKTTPAEYEVTLRVDPAGGINPNTAVSGTPSNSASWTQMTVEFTAGESGATLFLLAQNNGSWSSGGWAQFDGVRIEETSIPGNLPPSVAITNPADGAQFDAPATITLFAEALDPDGSVEKVAFFSADALIGESFFSPYSVLWENIPAGSYSLTAQATDDGDARSTSAPITIEVIGADSDPGVPPIYDVTIHAPPSVQPSERWWRLVKLRHLTCEENAGKHNLFTAFYYLDGTRVEEGWQNKVGWKKSADISGELPLEKNEIIAEDLIHGNLDLYWNDNASLEYLNLNGSIFQIQRISGVHTRHPDECPGNSLGHHSFIAVYEERIGPDAGDNTP